MSQESIFTLATAALALGVNTDDAFVIAYAVDEEFSDCEISVWARPALDRVAELVTAARKNALREALRPAVVEADPTWLEDEYGRPARRDWVFGPRDAPMWVRCCLVSAALCGCVVFGILLWGLVELALGR